MCSSDLGGAYAVVVPLVPLQSGQGREQITLQNRVGPFGAIGAVPIDFNHPLAGQRLTFEVDIIEVQG